MDFDIWRIGQKRWSGNVGRLVIAGSEHDNLQPLRRRAALHRTNGKAPLKRNLRVLASQFVGELAGAIMRDRVENSLDLAARQLRRNRFGQAVAGSVAPPG